MRYIPTTQLEGKVQLVVRPLPLPLDSSEGRLAELGPTTRGLTLIAVRALGATEEADEAVQEILARAVDAIRFGRVPAGVPLGAFVHGIARHVLADVLRRRVREATHIDCAAMPLPACHPSPLESLIRQEERDQVSWALGRLSDQDRRLLTKCFVDGASVQDIAEQSGVPAERLRKRKSRALERLRTLLAERFGHAAASAPTTVA